MKYFTSDLHFGDPRIGVNNTPNLFYRPFKSIDAQNSIILSNLQHILPNDELYIIGDLFYDINYIHILDLFPKCKIHLILGNYDITHINILSKYMEIHETLTIKLGEFSVYLNHYPKNCKYISDIDFSLVGHIHGLWKVQRNMINVSTDAWHFKPVTESEILFCYNAMQNFYDENVFPY